MVPSVCKPHVWSEPIVTALNLPLGALNPPPVVSSPSRWRSGLDATRTTSDSPVTTVVNCPSGASVVPCSFMLQHSMLRLVRNPHEL